MRVRLVWQALFAFFSYSAVAAQASPGPTIDGPPATEVSDPEGPGFWRTRRACGVNALYLFLQLHDVSVPYDQVVAATKVDQKGTDLAALMDAATRASLPCYVGKCSPATLGDIRLPAIVHCDAYFTDHNRLGHYFVLVARDLGRKALVLLDGVTGNFVFMDEARFAKTWSGYFLACRPRSVGVFTLVLVVAGACVCGWLLVRWGRVVTAQKAATVVLVGMVMVGGGTAQSSRSMVAVPSSSETAATHIAFRELAARLSEIKVVYCEHELHLQPNGDVGKQLLRWHEYRAHGGTFVHRIVRWDDVGFDLPGCAAYSDLLVLQKVRVEFLTPTLVGLGEQPLILDYRTTLAVKGEPTVVSVGLVDCLGCVLPNYCDGTQIGIRAKTGEEWLAPHHVTRSSTTVGDTQVQVDVGGSRLEGVAVVVDGRVLRRVRVLWGNSDAFPVAVVNEVWPEFRAIAQPAPPSLRSTMIVVSATDPDEGRMLPDVRLGTHVIDNRFAGIKGSDNGLSYVRAARANELAELVDAVRVGVPRPRDRTQMYWVFATSCALVLGALARLAR